MMLLDMIGLRIAGNEFKTLLVQLEQIDSEASRIVELPRLNLEDKAAIQLLFLSKFPGVIHEEDLRLAADQQQDANGFVLDAVMAKYDLLAPMAPYWEDFKLKTIQYYLEQFTGLIGIALRITQ